MTREISDMAQMLVVNPADEVQRIEQAVREMVFKRLKRRGAVIGVSGGIDSSVVAFVCARALGKERTIGLFTPDTDSSSDSLRLGRIVTDALGIRAFLEDITPLLQTFRCYERRDEAIRTVVPEYGRGFKCKIVLPDLLEANRYPIFSVVVQAPSGELFRRRLTAEAYLGIVAATNCKQRIRKMIEYYYADRYNYAVAGTPNRLEYDQGFFVKNGDGSADFKPIAHLYKSQVYQLAAYLGVPEEIQKREPTTDTYSLEQSQQEFYFSVPLAKMDLCLWGRNNDIPEADLARVVDLSEEQVKRAYAMIDSKRKAAVYLHLSALLVEEV
jgi:NAD+ synthase